MQALVSSNNMLINYNYNMFTLVSCKHFQKINYYLAYKFLNRVWYKLINYSATISDNEYKISLIDRHKQIFTRLTKG